MTKRIEEIDYLKGLTMLLVVVGHYYHPHILAFAIWSFHMPLFVILSGYFIKDASNLERFQREKVHIKKYIISYLYVCLFCVLYKVSVFLIKNYVFYRNQDQTIVELIKSWMISIVYAQGNDFSIGELVIPNVGAVWFLVALVIGHLVVNLAFWCNKYWQRYIVLLVISVPVILINSFVLLPFQMGTGPLFAWWMVVGFLVRKYADSSIIKKLQQPRLFWVIIVGSIWILSLLWELYINTPFDISSVNLKLNVIGFLGAGSGSLICYYIARLACKKRFLGIETVKKIGRNTLMVLCIHSIDIVCLTPIWDKMPITDWLEMISRMIIDLSLAMSLKQLIAVMYQNRGGR